jgi:hypothetical protein
MNEQIKQLMIEARLGPALLLHHWGKIDALTDSEQAELERLEKFALLIVQDCIDIISPYTVRMSRPGEEYLHPILEIKEHFGVEE